MTNYTEMIADVDTEGSIRNWVNDSRIPSTTILTEAEAWIYTKLRVRQMLVTQTGNLLINTDTITLPTGYLAPYYLRFTGTTQSRPSYKLLDFVLDQFTYNGDGDRITGTPQYYATDESNIQFDVMAFQQFAFLFKHYAKGTALGPTNLTNFLTDDYPRLLRMVCLHYAFEHLRNTKEKLYYLGVAQSMIADTLVDSDLELAGVDMAMDIGGGPWAS